VSTRGCSPCPPLAPSSSSTYCSTYSVPSSSYTVCTTTSAAPPAPLFSATRAVNSVAAAAASAAASAAAKAAAEADLEISRTVRRKNAEIEDLKDRYEHELCEVEQKLNRVKFDNCELQNE
jgi:hypothetical protein